MPREGNTCVGAGICQLAPHATCANDGDCPGEGDACVSYAFEATTAIPLREPVVRAAPTAPLLSLSTSRRGSRTTNGDGDTFDGRDARDRVTGEIQPMGVAASCPAFLEQRQRTRGGAHLRSAVPLPGGRDPEGDVVAFTSPAAPAPATRTATPTWPIRSCACSRSAPRADVHARAAARVADTALAVNHEALVVRTASCSTATPESGAAPARTATCEASRPAAARPRPHLDGLRRPVVPGHAGRPLRHVPERLQRPRPGRHELRQRHLPATT